MVMMECPVSARSPRLLCSYKSAARCLLSKAGALVLQRPRGSRGSRAPEPRNCRRLVVLGAPRSGKTGIVRRFLREDLPQHYEPTREDFHRKLYRIRGEAYQIDILDPAGEREFPAKRRLTILTGDIFLLVFSLDDRRSFDEVCSLRSEIFRAKTALLGCQTEKGASRVPVVVCANKSDLPEEERVVSRAELLRTFGGENVFETSAMEGGAGLERAFEALVSRAGLPMETGPSRHRRVSMRSYHRLPEARKAEAPCGALHPLARRPSVGTDLRFVLATRDKTRTSKTVKK